MCELCDNTLIAGASSVRVDNWCIGIIFRAVLLYPATTFHLLPRHDFRASSPNDAQLTYSETFTQVSTRPDKPPPLMSLWGRALD